MPTSIALLRGINVGGKHALPMRELTVIMESLGLTDVRTCIQSGNVVFRSPRKPAASLGERISETIEQRHGFAPRVLILSAARLAEIIDANPFPHAEAEPKTLHLFFLENKPAAPRLDEIKTLAAPTERFKLIDDVFYLHTPDGFGRSKLAAKVENLLNVPATARNWRTVPTLLIRA